MAVMALMVLVLAMALVVVDVVLMVYIEEKNKRILDIKQVEYIPFPIKAISFSFKNARYFLHCNDHF
jgi:hypothetical protein